MMIQVDLFTFWKVNCEWHTGIPGTNIVTLEKHY